LAGSLTLMLVVLPIVIISSQEALRVAEFTREGR
jgi:ABC-type phosphate transport system permease subunit